MNRIFISAVVVTILQTGNAQNLTWEINATSEVQYNIQNGQSNWANLINMSVDANLWKNTKAETEAIVTYNLNEENPIADDLQGYSNINANSRPFRLSILGISQQLGNVTLFVGIRNTGPDYFTSEHISLFTGSSHGIHAPLANNYAVATYPTAQLCLHTEWKITKNMTLRSSLYNGNPGETMKEQLNLSNKIKNISTVSYKISEEEDNGYFCLGEMTGQNILNHHATAVFGIVEYPIITTSRPLLCGIFEGAYDNSPVMDETMICRSYYATGGVLHLDKTDNRHLGIVVNQALYMNNMTKTRETDFEMTYSQSLGKCCIQPVLHIIKTGKKYNSIAMLRFSIEINKQ
jgi:hypothetical protein